VLFKRYVFVDVKTILTECILPGTISLAYRLKIRVLIEILEATKSSVVILIAVARLSMDVGVRRCAHVSSFLSYKNSNSFNLSP
jgi:hypothetical protein